MSFYYLEVLFVETYKILFLILPILTAVALIVWLDRRVWAFVQKEGAKCSWSFWSFSIIG